MRYAMLKPNGEYVTRRELMIDSDYQSKDTYESYSLDIIKVLVESLNIL